MLLKELIELKRAEMKEKRQKTSLERERETRRLRHKMKREAKKKWMIEHGIAQERLPDRLCEGCGTAFTPKTKNHRFHCKDCRTVWHKALKSESQQIITITHTFAPPHTKQMQEVQRHEEQPPT